MGTAAREAVPTLCALLIQTLAERAISTAPPHDDLLEHPLPAFDKRVLLDSDPAGDTVSLIAFVLMEIAPDLLFPPDEMPDGSEPTIQGNFPSPLGPAMIRLLVNALADPRERVRQEAADALHYFGHYASASIPALIQLLDDEEDMCRRSSARTLQHVCP